ncbi:MAG: hypothetical protein ACJAXR_001274 [Halopseudomonas sp.]|jgi:hypothetical protein
MGEPYTGRVCSVFSAGLPIRVSVANDSALDPVLIQLAASRFADLEAVLHTDGMFFPVGFNRV